MDRASGFEPEGCRFEPCRGHPSGTRACSPAGVRPLRSVLIAGALGAFRNPCGLRRERSAAMGRTRPAVWPAPVTLKGPSGRGRGRCAGARTATRLMVHYPCRGAKLPRRTLGWAFARELPRENPLAGDNRAQQCGSLTIWVTRRGLARDRAEHGEPGGQSRG